MERYFLLETYSGQFYQRNLLRRLYKTTNMCIVSRAPLTNAAKQAAEVGSTYLLPRSDETEHTHTQTRNDAAKARGERTASSMFDPSTATFFIEKGGVVHFVCSLTKTRRVAGRVLVLVNPQPAQRVAGDLPARRRGLGGDTRCFSRRGSCRTARRSSTRAAAQDKNRREGGAGG